MNQNENCHVCKKTITEQEKFIECELCGNYSHLECSQIKIGLRRCVDCKGEEE